jgi:hypothetical protein
MIDLLSKSSGDEWYYQKQIKFFKELDTVAVMFFKAQ